MNILVVDDDLVDRKLVRRTLNSPSSFAHEITEAQSVPEGLEVLEGAHFDVILLDYSMPEVDGIEMLIEVRAKPDLGNTAIVMISASEDTDLALACIEAGAQDFLPKSEITHTKLTKAILHARKRFELEQRMHEGYLAAKKMAERDALTGLSNRYHFEEILKVMIASNQRTRQSVALLALDLDDFKHVNDTLGHDVGDQVLVEAVKRISTCLRQNEGFARLGGDEFAVIIGGITDINQVSAISQRIMEQFEVPFSVRGQEINCGISIGAALCPADAAEPNELMKCADIAMYRSKQSGKNEICFYEARYQAEFHRRVAIQHAITRVMRQDGFILFYQPIFSLREDTIVGVEALIRWPEESDVYRPDEFIPIAEESRLIDSLGQWIIGSAVAQLAHWQNILERPLTMSINISPVQLRSKDFVSHLMAAVEATQVSPEDVVLEITETALFADSEKIGKTLDALSDQGFKIALDDFGMGYSSIAHLVDYPIDIVKLDKTMQTAGEGESKRQRVLTGLALMLRELEFEVVAEGIETAEQRDHCIDLGLEKVQGYLLAKPMPADEVTSLLGQASA